MNTDVTLRAQSGGESPFDAIRNPDGRWSARDLMIVMGYAEWRNFKVPVDRAMKAAENQGHEVTHHFVGSRKVSGQRGPGQEDYLLTRFAAYLVAMNGDPNKPEVAAAQAYFAIRTNQAEQIEQRSSRVIDITERRLRLLQAAHGLVDPKHLEAKARIQLAIGLGEAPELNPADTPLYAQTYLEEKGLSRAEVKSVGGVFGKRVKAAYILEHGDEPKQYPLETATGQVRPVNAYTEGDRPIFDAVWNKYYGDAA